MNEDSLIKDERAVLLPYKPPLELAEISENTVNTYSLICVDTVFYSVPEEWVGKCMTVKKYHDGIRVFSGDTPICKHHRAFGNGTFFMENRHLTIDEILSLFETNTFAAPKIPALSVVRPVSEVSVLFVSVPNLVIELREAMSRQQITAYRKKFERFDLVILDELGYISFDKLGSELLFNLLSSRNDKGSIVITTNLTFERWVDIFGDPTLTGAMVDRLAHKAHVLDISREKGGRLEETLAWLGVGG